MKIDRNLGAPSLGAPYLEHFPDTRGTLQRVVLDHFPFRLGRDATADLVVYCPSVSKGHAEILFEEDVVYIKDLESTNGTFVNGTRIRGRAMLASGDIIHLAQKELRFNREEVGEHHMASPVTESAMPSGFRSLITDAGHLRVLIEYEQVSALFQPIVNLSDGQTVGYEALGRGRHPSLPVSPGPLFALAHQLRQAGPLSRVFRRVALGESQTLPKPHALFLNMHPDELPDHEMLESLRQLPRHLTDQEVVLEVHEDFIADTRTLERLRSHLREVGVKLAYDDFGVGQARLAALAQVPPDYVKIDMTITHGLLHSRAMRELVRALGQVCTDVGCKLLAEGLETEEEAAVCQDLGCQLGQGFLFSKPQAATLYH